MTAAATQEVRLECPGCGKGKTMFLPSGEASGFCSNCQRHMVVVTATPTGEKRTPPAVRRVVEVPRLPIDDEAPE
jgi:hypothetical protein